MGRFNVDLMFASRAMEDRFREIISTGKEVGGWFITDYLWSRYWNDAQINYQGVMTSLNPELSVEVIDDVIIVPNRSGSPESSWSVQNVVQAQETARATARFHRSSCVFWHSHPGGRGFQNLSVADMNFALNCLSAAGRQADICVATLNPLRVIQYHVDYRPEKNLDVQVSRGQFHSWRKKALRKFWKGFA